ncbi:MAG: cytochrome C oxidase subunit IV family protein [Planctomycetota bacterium]|jgi:cytochrome c oxidase subunit 4|nr:cytochrome C oxidase subunit IV family protein [Planctomycetota bacterium]
MEHEHHEEQGHEVSFGIFALIWLGLMVLTGLTVVAAGVDLGNANVIIALVIATIKVTLVGAFFMHLKYEPLYIKLMVAVAILILVIILSLTFLDTGRWTSEEEIPEPDKTSLINT